MNGLGKNINYTKYINYVAIAYAFILPLSRAGIVFFSILLIILWLFEGEWKEKFKLLKQNKVALSIIAFLLFACISLLWTDEVAKAFRYIKKYWYFLPIFVLFTSIKREYITKIISAFIFGMFISEVISYGVFFELWQFKHATPENPSPFMHHIEYSVFLAFTALILLNRIFNEEDMKHKIFYTFFFLTVSGNLFLTAGRTGQFAFIIGLFVLALVSFKNKLKALTIAIILGVLVIGIAFNVSTTFHDRVITGKNNLLNVVENKNYCTSWGMRVGAWIVSKDIVMEDPILGLGFADNMKEFHHIIDEKYPSMKCMHTVFMHVHNQYLQVLIALGFVGLFLFLAIFYRIGRLQIDDQELSNMRYVYIAVLFFAFIPEVLLHRQFNMVLFALIIGLFLAQNRIENEVKND